MRDEQLVALAQSGDDEAMRTLIAKYTGLLYTLANDFYVATGDRDDLDQEALIAFWLAVRGYRGDNGASFHSFVHVVVRRRLITAIKLARAGKNEILTTAVRVARERDSDEIVPVLDTVEDPKSDPHSHLERRETLRLLRGVRESRLSPLERDVLNGVANGERYLALQERLGHPLSRWADGRPRAKVVENAFDRAQRKIRAELEEAA